MSGISLPGDTGRPQSAAATGQRRYLTLLFADLSGSTRLGAALEAEHYFAVLAEFGRLAREVISRHGGTVVRMQGDGVLAIFGHPETSEADGRHAVEATLELHEAVRALRFEPADGPPLTLTMHSGIHAGLVLVSEGDVERGRFELTGSAPNIAARLSDAARADEILVSEEPSVPPEWPSGLARAPGRGARAIACLGAVLGSPRPGEHNDSNTWIAPPSGSHRSASASTRTALPRTAST